MCGITGIIDKDASLYIEKMTEAVAHRGPDSSGIFNFENLALGHRRLAIQDLSELGHQPMSSLDDRYIIIFNGEIYNHWEIRNELTNKYSFKSTSDTETILYGYIEYGTALFNKLNGIFALSIFDKLNNKLVIARDQFGVKPLYYSLGSDFLLFGSEIKSFLTFPKLEKTIDVKSLANYIYFLWSPGLNTPFKNCKKLLPGHYIEVDISDLTTFQIVKYYEVTFNGVYSKKTELELIDELDSLLNKAVKRQLLSDVPVGFFLSGGLDSSLVVAMARKLNPDQKYTCFTIETGPAYEGFVDDLPFAKKVAEFLNVELRIVLAKIDIVKDFDKMIYHLDEPQGDPAPLNVYNITKRARELGIVVLLGGTAGDDLFSGYRRHQSILAIKYFRYFPVFLFNWMKVCFSKFSLSSLFIRRVNKFFEIFTYKNTIERSAALYGWLEIEKVKKLFNKGQLVNFNPIQFFVKSLENIPNEKSDLNKMLYWDLKYFLVDHNLNYTDKMSMANGVEVRVPYLDKDLVEFSTKIPPNLKMKGTTTKYLLKKVAERYLPNEIIYRPKSGFGAPIRDWVINKFDARLIEMINNSNQKMKEIFDLDQTKTLIDENKKFKIDASYSIWAMLAIGSWIKQFSLAKSSKK